MPTIRAGQVATSEVLSNQLVIDMSNKVLQYDPPGNPYTHIMTKQLGKDEVTQTKTEWLEDDIVPYWDTLAEALDNSETEIDVTNPTYWQVGDLMKVVQTDEVCRVTAVGSTSVTVTRAWAGTATSADTAGYLLNLRTAQMEGDVSPEARATVKVAKYNFTEIVRTPVHITNTNLAVKHYHGNELDYQRRKAGESHGVALEQISMHGRRKEDTSTYAKPIRSAGGLNEAISTNELDANGALTETRFIDFMDQAFRYSVGGSRTSKLLFASGALINTINSWGLAKLQFNDKVSGEYKINVSDYHVGGYSLQVIRHKLLENGYDGWGFIVDPDGAKYCYLTGRDTQLKVNIQDNAEDGRKDEYLTELTFKFGLEKAHSRIRDVTFA